MWSAFVRFLQYVSHSVRHLVLDHAHPLPKTVRVYPGAHDSIYRSLVLGVLDTCRIPGTVVVESSEQHRPSMWLEDEAKSVEGCMTVCRYFGKQWRLLPVNPATCADVDSSLELLQSFLYPIVGDLVSQPAQLSNHVATFCSLLEDTFRFDDVCHHLNGFEADTLADLCWASAWRHVIDKHQIIIDEVEYPRLYEWMQYQNIVSSDDDTEDDDDPSEETGTNDDVEDDDDKKDR
jgi:hypothetical protein